MTLLLDHNMFVWYLKIWSIYRKAVGGLTSIQRKLIFFHERTQRIGGERRQSCSWSEEGGGGSLFYRNIDGPRFALLKLRLVGHLVRTQQS